ncbi:ribonuclease D [Azospirillum brasilense]|uniref:Ribonuclease D n=1 Tax=Azospirillum brasilense TaxID=192 RepID=A0A0P0EFS2_AZOBR|nr:MULTISPECIES: ribonuclease H-like domain-containing protein [Azospirillum]ALJ37904.1 3'-5' exonuclease [Azospirillum brasilense]MDW7556605.1 ribonuclease H-like domain-containing protein [Azospirillum brasilense]MDW7596373.1 ribonuclease H-like domain-containing protein [Azospirillum brasilense]MDW7631263.1 ribonuclease H-like domain-containing protein [Azospirillum brasilense]MDX5951883.1 ribonuclease H-like domain-containing protein [Azospirillum brasilense]
MPIDLHDGDLPDGLDLKSLARGGAVAIDTETMGLNPHRDRLCLVQLSPGDGTVHLVQFRKGQYEAPNLKRLLADPEVTKLFHFARFDVAVMRAYLGVACQPVYCTKVASKLVRTFTDRHGLKDLVKDLLGVELSKQQQSSDWGAAELTPEQMKYAASDVLHLHDLKEKLDVMLAREGRTHLAKACFDFLPARGELDLGGWEQPDILSH